ncbi:DUF397 domain-containing protein [Nonomuraea sp. NPDC048826]
MPGAEDAYAVRDSKNPDAGTLRFTGSRASHRRSVHP